MLTAGSKLGPYEILSALGAGGMGEVYRARDTRLDRTVAIKILPPGFADDAERLRRFEQEARTISTLNHPNVLTIYDVGTQDGIHYLVSELLEGGTLRDRMRADRLSVRKTVEIAGQIAEGLAAAHENGIVHRDLKPENVMVTPEGRVKILDFGLAKSSAAAAAMGSEELTRTVAAPATREGVVLGTVGYMSPEQVRGKAADHRSDIFSFGVILYEMLAGQRAFAGDSSVEVMNAILKDDPPELAALRPSVSPALQRIVARCLEKSPAERFQSARDLAFAVENSSSAPGSTTAQAALQGGKRPRWVVAAIVAAVFVLALAAALALGFKQGAASRPIATYHQLNYRREVIFRALMAPDGKTVIYSAAQQGNVPELFALSPEYPEARSLGLHDVQLLSISSKSELALLTHATYLAHRLYNGTLATMPLGGGAPRELLENVREADWAPDGSALAIIRNVNGRDRLEYPIGKVLVETGGYLSDLRFSPDGTRIAYFEHPQLYDDRGGVAVVDLAGQKKLLADGYWGEEGLAWDTSGKEVLYSAGTGYGNFKVYGVTPGSAPRSLLQSAGGLILQDVLPSGRWLAVRLVQRRSLNARFPGWTQERDLSWLDLSNLPFISHDSSFIAFQENSGAAGINYKVCLRRVDGSPVVVLGDGGALSISPDDRWVLADIPTDPQQLVLYPTGPGESRKLERGAMLAYTSGSWFPDGKQILICGNQAAEAPRCFVQQIGGGAPQAVTPEGTSGALLAPDGKRVLAVDTAGHWSLYPLGGGAPEAVKGLQANDNAVRFTADGKSVVVMISGVPARLETVDLADGRRKPLLTLAPSDLSGVINASNAAVSDDGRSYVYTADHVQSTLYDIEWTR